MSDPFRSFQQQPWLALGKVAGITTSIALALDGIATVGLSNSDAIAWILNGVLGLVLLVLASVGVGVLGVYLCERWGREISLNQGSLWALVLCLFVGIGLKSLIPLPQALVPFDSTSLMGIVLGVFWKGRPYWQRFW